MTDNQLEPLILDFIEWLAEQPRPYSLVMETWRTSCPRLPVWEEAVDRGLIRRQRHDDSPEAVIVVSDRGLALLHHYGRLQHPAVS